MSENPQIHARNFALNFLFAGFSAAFARSLVTPIEKLDLILPKEPKPGDLVNSLMKVTRESGISAFWRGNLGRVIRYAPSSGFSFAFKDLYKKAINSYNPDTDFWKFLTFNLISGGAAGLTSGIILYPLDLARSRLVADTVTKGSTPKQFIGLGDCIVKTFKSKGVRGVYEGFGLAALTMMAYRACYFGCYDSFRTVFTVENRKMDLIFKFLLAQVVTHVSSYASSPFETIRRRVITQSEGKLVFQPSGISYFKKIYEAEGQKTFFKKSTWDSSGFRLVVAPLVLVLYEELQRKFYTPAREI